MGIIETIITGESLNSVSYGGSDTPGDTIPPTGESFAINGGDTTTTLTNVTLNITCATDAVDETVQVAFGETTSPTNWTSCTTGDYSYTLSTGNGTKTVYVKFKDSSENESVSISKNIENTFLCGGSFTDPRDNQIYSTVKIGTQCWFTKNLNIGTIVGFNEQGSSCFDIKKSCYTSDSSCSNYGGYYTRTQAMCGEQLNIGNQGICPDGWRIPTKTDFENLLTTIGCGVNEICNNLRKLIHAENGGTNELGYALKWGGNCSIGGSCIQSGAYGYYWTSSWESESSAFYVAARWQPNNVTYKGINIGTYWGIAYYLMNIRCIKD